MVCSVKNRRHKFTWFLGLSYKAMKPEGNIKLIRVQSENGEPVKKEATFDDIIMLVFFLNQDPRCKDSRYKVGQRLFVGKDSPPQRCVLYLFDKRWTLNCNPWNSKTVSGDGKLFDDSRIWFDNSDSPINAVFYQKICFWFWNGFLSSHNAHFTRFCI